MDLIVAQIASSLGSHSTDQEAMQSFVSTCSDEDAGIFARGKLIDLSWEADNNRPTDDELRSALGEDATPVEIDQAGVFSLGMRWMPIQQKWEDIMDS